MMEVVPARASHASRGRRQSVTQHKDGSDPPLPTHMAGHGHGCTHLHLRPRPPGDGAERAEEGEGVAAVRVKRFPEAENQVGPEDEDVRPEEERPAEGGDDVADLTVVDAIRLDLM